MMISIEKGDQKIIIEILSESFGENKSVRYLTGSGRNYRKRIKGLIKYSLLRARSSGKVYLTEDKKACALIIFPHKERKSIKSVLWDINLVLFTVGINNIRKILRRESRVNSLHPKEPFYYLWYIGVSPDFQNKGKGTALLSEIIEDARKDNCSIFLETSTERNLPWYRKNGFSQFSDPLEFNFSLYPLNFKK